MAHDRSIPSSVSRDNPRYLNPNRQQWPSLFIPDWLMARTDLNGGHKLVYAELCNEVYAQHYDRPPRTCEITLDDLAQRIGSSPRAIAGMLTKLEQRHMIRLLDRTHATRVYEILEVRHG